MRKVVIILFLFGSVVANAQIDTLTKQCFCGGQTVFVRFGYDMSLDSVRTIEIKDANDSVVYTKAVHYKPSVCVGYILDGSELKRITNDFDFFYMESDIEDDYLPIYKYELCDRITNAKIEPQ